MDWTHHQRPVHAHIVHPSPVRAHSYPLTLYHESISSEFSKLDRFDSHDHNEPLTHHRPVPVHQWSYSSKSQAPQSPASLAHDLPSPPLSATMPDPWLTDRSDDQPEEWGGRQVLPPAPQIIPAPPTASGKTRTPVSPKRSLSPMSRKLLAPVTLEVWSSLMDKSKGRDKVLKTVQYSLRTYLYVLGVIASMRPLTRWFMANRKRSQQAVAGLSLTRKCLLLLNPLRPAGALLSPEPTSARAFLGHLVELCSTLADDIFCLSKLGLVSKRKGIKADTWANRIWFFSTLLGLWTMHVKSYTTRKEEEKRADDWQVRKYLCDLVFVSYDIFHLTTAKEPVQCIAGLSAALISTGQLYQKEWVMLSKKEHAKI